MFWTDNCANIDNIRPLPLGEINNENALKTFDLNNHIFIPEKATGLNLQIGSETVLSYEIPENKQFD